MTNCLVMVTTTEMRNASKWVCIAQKHSHKYKINCKNLQPYLCDLNISQLKNIKTGVGNLRGNNGQTINKSKVIIELYF